jgi:excisionase family DNA binding protein
MASTYVPIKDVADYFNVSVSTIRNWIRSGTIPEDTYIKAGETYRFSLDRVENALLRSNESKENDK